jgi:hypothetical protein
VWLSKGRGLRRRIISGQCLRLARLDLRAARRKKPKASLPWAESTIEEVEETTGSKARWLVGRAALLSDEFSV